MTEFSKTSSFFYAQQENLKGKKVMIVDRHPNARNTLRMMLSELGINGMHGVASSFEALRQVRSFTYDIILADYLLDDGRDGQQLLEELRHKQLIPLSTVYIVVTAERAYKNVVSVAELAPDDYLIKPFTAEQIHQRLARALHKKHVFTDVYRFYDDSAYDQALAACDLIAEREREFQLDVWRFKGELLNSLGRHHEAEALYQQILASKVVPWAKMGLAVALHGLGQSEEAESLTLLLIKDCPTYLAAYDFLARVRESSDNLKGAQDALVTAASISPNNTLRQRLVGDIAVRNGDYATAEKAYAMVVDRGRGSSLRGIDDYANLSRVRLEQDNVDGARHAIQELRRDWRGNQHGEMAAHVLDSLAHHQIGNNDKAKSSLDQALALHGELSQYQDAKHRPLPQKISIDLAHACLSHGDKEKAQSLLRQVAAENHEDRDLIAHIENVFKKTGDDEGGRLLIKEVSSEIVDINNRGVLKARAGDLQGAVELLSEAADRMPNLQFLVNACKAIFTLLNQQGWDELLAEKGRNYLLRARFKDATSPKVVSAWELYQQVAKKFGVPVLPLVEPGDKDKEASTPSATGRKQNG